MKIIKKALGRAMVMALLFLIIAGCSQTAKLQDTINFLTDDETNKPNEQSSLDTSTFVAPNHSVDFEINNIGKEINFKDEILRQINVSKYIDKKHEDYQYYSDNKISDIIEFYIPPNKIGNYALCGVLLSENLFRFYYSPVDELAKGIDYVFNPLTGIRLSIERMEDDFASDPLKPIMEQNEQQGFEYLFKDNMVYTKKLKDIFGQIDNSRFRFRVLVPEKLNNYEFLHEFSRKIIETSEFIVVDK